MSNGLPPCDEANKVLVYDGSSASGMSWRTPYVDKRDIRVILRGFPIDELKRMSQEPEASEDLKDSCIAILKERLDK